MNERDTVGVSIDDAVRLLRNDPASQDVVRDAYLGRDVADSARRFRSSGEFQEVRRLIGTRLAGAHVLDIGAGTGIASAAFLAEGAGRAIALEPDPSEEVGIGALARLDPDRRIEVLDSFAEEIPLDAESIDIVYARQVLHHAGNLPRLLEECARVLRPGGLFIACREHVVDDERQLAEFLASHPVHRLAGGEHAFPLRDYVGAIRGAGLLIDHVFGPWASLINAYPEVCSAGQLEAAPRQVLARRFGLVGDIAGRIAWVRAIVRRRRYRALPGRLYTFVAHKPAGA